MEFAVGDRELDVDGPSLEGLEVAREFGHGGEFGVR
jgi:hypothetical protein